MAVLAGVGESAGRSEPLPLSEVVVDEGGVVVRSSSRAAPALFEELATADAAATTGTEPLLSAPTLAPVSDLPEDAEEAVAAFA